MVISVDMPGIVHYSVNNSSSLCNSSDSLLSKQPVVNRKLRLTISIVIRFSQFNWYRWPQRVSKVILMFRFSDWLPEKTEMTPMYGQGPQNLVTTAAAVAARWIILRSLDYNNWRAEKHHRCRRPSTQLREVIGKET